MAIQTNSAGPVEGICFTPPLVDWALFIVPVSEFFSGVGVAVIFIVVGVGVIVTTAGFPLGNRFEILSRKPFTIRLLERIIIIKKTIPKKIRISRLEVIVK